MSSSWSLVTHQMCPMLPVCNPAIRIYFHPLLNTFISDGMVARVSCCYFGWLEHSRPCRKRSMPVDIVKENRQGVPARSGSCSETAYSTLTLGSQPDFEILTHLLWRYPSHPERDSKLTYIAMFWGGSQIKFGITYKGWVFGAIGCVLSKLVALEIERTLASFVTVGMEKRSFLMRYLVNIRCLIRSSSTNLKPIINW